MLRFFEANIKEIQAHGIKAANIVTFSQADEFQIDLDSDIGKCLSFTSERFDQSSYLFKKGNYIFISFIFSKQKGNFKALCNRIIRSDFGIKIPTPLGRMKGIVQRAGYRHTVEQDPVMGPVDVWVMDVQRYSTLIIKNEASIVCMICYREVSRSMSGVDDFYCPGCGKYHGDQGTLFDSRI